jgi:hypothetical protein
MLFARLRRAPSSQPSEVGQMGHSGTPMTTSCDITMSNYRPASRQGVTIRNCRRD